MKKVSIIIRSSIIEFFIKRNKIKQARFNAKIKAINEYRYTSSWQSEWFILLFSAPFFLSFIPFTQSYITIGFDRLNALPSWYLWCLFSAVISHFVIRLAEKYHV